MPVFVAAGIGAVASVVGGIFGANEASNQNAQAQQNYEEQRRRQQEIADATNAYNKKAFEVEQQNYINQYNYQWETAIQTYQRQAEIQDYEYLQSLRQYSKDLKILSDQIDFNDLAAEQAFKTEDLALNNLFQQQVFDRESQLMGLKQTLYEGELNRAATQAEFEALSEKNEVNKISITEEVDQALRAATFEKEKAYVKTLEKQGGQQLRQAGKSARKGRQASIAEYYRGMSELNSALMGTKRRAALKFLELDTSTAAAQKQLAIQNTRISAAMSNASRDVEFNLKVLDANITSAVEQSLLNKQDIALRQYGANLNAVAQTMIRPERLTYNPAPIAPPERIFIEPQKALPGFTPAPVQQSVWAPIVGGITNAASLFANPGLYE